MSSVSGISGQQGQQTTTGKDAYGDLDLQAFLKMLMAELQNQDPLNPMDNAQILQQVSSIKAIESNQRLTDTLDAVRLQQNVATANNLLQRTVAALTDKQERVAGAVDGVLIQDGTVKLRIGENTVDLKNVSEIVPEGTEIPAQADTSA